MCDSNKSVAPAKAGAQELIYQYSISHWIPAFAGMTVLTKSIAMVAPKTQRSPLRAALL